MATKKDSEDDKKVFDVANPKDAKLDIGSKPMVIGHKSSADTTIKSDETEAKTDEPEVTLAPSKKIVINPISEPVGTTDEPIEPKDEKEPETASTETATEEAPAEDPTETKETTEEKPADNTSTTAEEPENKPEDDPKPVKESSDEEGRDFAAEAEHQEQTAQEAEEKREDVVEELKKSKKYLIHINEKRETGFGKLLAVLFAVLVSIFGVYAMADAGVIPGGELLPMRFIGQNETIADTTKVETPQPTTKTEESTQPDNEAEDKTQQNDTIEIDTTQWTLLEGEGFSMRIPDGWSLRQKQGNDGSFVSDKKLSYSQGTPGLIEDYEEGVLPSEGMFELYLDNTSGTECSFGTDNTIVSETTFTTIDGAEVTKWVEEGSVPVEQRSLGQLADGESSVSYCVDDPNSNTLIRTQYLVDTEDDMTVYLEAAVKTISFVTE